MRFILTMSLVFFSFTQASANEINAGEFTVTSSRAGKGTDPNELVGSYHQPRWTSMRAFSNTRTYVIPKGAIGVEYWIQNKVDRATTANYFLTRREVEVGLGGGFQLDLYYNEVRKYDQKIDTEGYQVEIRYALGDWGQIPLNPTIYVEYHAVNSGNDKGEAKLLVGDSFWSDWRWGANLFYEWELFGADLEREHGVTLALGRSLCPYLTVGAEGKAEFTTTQADRSKITDEYYIGPSLRWQPIMRANILVTTLIGTNYNAHKTETMAIFSLDI